MQKKLFILFIFLFSGIASSFAEAPYDGWWLKGNALYQQKEYDSAAYYYEKIAALQPQNATVYYNLGNTYYRLNKIGPAVLNYERALNINPKYKEAKDNLTLTQARIGNRIASGTDIFFVKWWKSTTQGETASTWAVVSLLIFLLVIAALIIKRFRGNAIRIPSQLVGFLCFVWVVCMGFAVTAAKNKSAGNKAVVMQNDAPLLNGQKGKTQSLVPEGTTVEIKDSNDGWVEVLLPDGRRGWMQTSLLNKI